MRELQTALVMTADDVGVCIVPESIKGMNHVDLAFRNLTCAGTVPMILSHRVDHRPDELRGLLSVFADNLCRMGFPSAAFILDTVAG